MVRAGYGDEGGFKKSIKNLDKQTQLEQEDSIAATADAKDQVISRNRKAYEHEPDNIDNLTKLVRSLLQKEEEDYENEAIALLQKGFKQFDQYRFKMQIGDIRMKQFNRQSRELRARLKNASDDEKKAEVMEQLKQVAEEQLAFELSEFAERVKNYPTDMGIKFQYGRRQFAAGQYDDSISSFQEAQSDPKHRSHALRYLGEAFAKKGWYEEAIDTFRRGIDAHPHDDDRLAMELRYELMKALHASAEADEDLGSAEEAGKIASTIAQTDINYKDIRQWIDQIRGLIKKLKDGDKNDAA